MANLFAKPRARRYRHGFVRCPNHWLQNTLRLRDCAALSQRSRLDQRHNKPDRGVGRTSDHRGLSLGRGSPLYDPGPRSDLRHRCHTAIARHGHSGQAHCTSLTLAERLCRAADRINPSRVFGPYRHPGRGAFASNSKILRSLLQQNQDTSVSGQRYADLAASSADGSYHFKSDPWRTSSPLYPNLGFRYTQADHANDSHINI